MARSTAWSAALVLCVAACSSAPNGPGASATDGGDAQADVDAADTAMADAAETGDAPLKKSDGGSRCPAAFTTRAEGDPCYAVLTACDYPEGRCGCVVCEVDATSFGYVWSCRGWDTGGDGCPARSPRAGSACDTLGLQCRYGASCSISVGDDLDCGVSGTWEAAPPEPACGYQMCPG